MKERLPHLFTTKDLRGMLGCCPTTLTKYIRKHGLRPKLGSRQKYLFTRTDLVQHCGGGELGLARLQDLWSGCQQRKAEYDATQETIDRT